MDHDLTTARGAGTPAGLQTGGPDTGGAEAGPQAPSRPRGESPGRAGAIGSGAAGGDGGDGGGDGGPRGRNAGVDGGGGTATTGTVRLASPGSVIASIPFLFGFHPENSLVVLGVGHSAEGGSFIRHGVRIDLDQVRGHERTTALELAARLRDQDAGIAILVAFGPRAATGTKARPDHCRKLMAAFRAQLEAAPIEERVTVVDALYTANGRWWSYMCRNNRCCPAAGTVLPAEAPAALTGALATRGHRVYASREALDATLAPYPPDILARTATAADLLDRTWYDSEAGLADARRLMDTLLARCGTDAPTGRHAPRTRAEGPRAGRRGLAGSASLADTAARARSATTGQPGASDLATDALSADRSALSDPAAGTSTAVPSPSPKHASATGWPAATGSAGDAHLTQPRDEFPAVGDAGSPDSAVDPSKDLMSDDPTSDPTGLDKPSPGAHTAAPSIPAARSSRRVSNRVPSLPATSDGAPDTAAEPPGSLLAPPVVTDAEAAQLLIALLNWRVRDYLACAAATVDSARRLLRLCAELARRAPRPELRLAPYALAAWAAWAIGRPAIAQCAVDRALAIDPEYKFASLIRAGLHHAIDGEGVRESAASTRRDLFGEAAVESGAINPDVAPDVVASDVVNPGAADFDSTAPDTPPSPIPSPRSTTSVPTESGTDLEVP